jgi:hypothetical protein
VWHDFILAATNFVMDPMSTDIADLAVSCKTPDESNINNDERRSNSSNNKDSSNNNDNMITIAETDDPTPSTLTWTKWNDPDYENFSDWTIIVTVKNGTEGPPQVDDNDDDDDDVDQDNEGDNDDERSETETCHSATTSTTFFVHKAVVAVGARSSHYFRRLFTTTSSSRNKRNGPTTAAHGSKETTTNGSETPSETTTATKRNNTTSRFELEYSAARAFPAMLDFMYAPTTTSNNMHATTTFQTSTESAVALRYLAQYFGIPALLIHVNGFIQGDMNKYNVELYLKEAKVYKDHRIIDGTVAVTEESMKDDLLVCGATLPPEPSFYMKLLPTVKRGDLLYRLLLQTASELHRTRQELGQVKAQLGRDGADVRSRKRPRTTSPPAILSRPTPRTPSLRERMVLPKVLNLFSK